jgi:hypothetical protein
MFFPVTVYDSNGKVKKIITPRSLGKRHWAEFRKIKTTYLSVGKTNRFHAG